MRAILNFYKLVRGTNLIIIALSMYFLQYFLISPMMSYVYLRPSLSPLYFSLLVFSVCCIAAAGNIINDYLDFENDRKFKPHKTVLGKTISLSQAFNLQVGLNVVGIAMAYFLAWKIGKWEIGNLFVATAAFLWLYSIVLKKYFLIGNLVVAMLSAFVFGIVALYEPKIYDASLSESLQLYFSTVWIQIKGYALFAFLVSLIREIIKDAEDKEADAARNMKTLPILLSQPATNTLIAILIAIVVGLLAFVAYTFFQMKAMNHFWYILLALIMTLLVNIVSAFTAKTSLDYKNLSVFLKLNMLFGVFSLPAFYLLTKYFGA